MVPGNGNVPIIAQLHLLYMCIYAFWEAYTLIGFHLVFFLSSFAIVTLLHTSSSTMATHSLSRESLPPPLFRVPIDVPIPIHILEAPHG